MPNTPARHPPGANRAVDRRLDPHLHPGRQDLEQKARGGLMPFIGGGDPQRVELAGMLRVGAQNDHRRTLCHLAQLSV